MMRALGEGVVCGFERAPSCSRPQKPHTADHVYNLRWLEFLFFITEGEALWFAGLKGGGFRGSLNT